MYLISIENIPKFSKRVIVAVLTFFILFGGLILYLSLLRQSADRYLLVIKTQPEGSSIKINDELSSETTFEERLPAGNYIIEVSKDRYQTHIQEVNLIKDTELTIALKLSPTGSDGISVIEKINIEQQNQLSESVVSDANIVTEGTVVAYDLQSSRLVKITQNSKETLYAGEVSFYSFNNPYVITVDNRNARQILVLDVNSKSVVRRIDSGDLGPVVYATTDSSLRNIYFISNIDPISKNSILYSSSVTNFDPKEIKSTKAREISLLSTKNQLVLFYKVDGIDASEVEVIDLANARTILLDKGNNYLVSPNERYIALQTSKLVTISDLDMRTKKSLPSSLNEHLFWLDNDNLVILKNTYPGVEGYTINATNPQPLELSFEPSIKDITVREIIGLLGNKLYILDRNYLIQEFSISIPRD
jgi:hypothetical protein